MPRHPAPCGVLFALLLAPVASAAAPGWDYVDARYTTVESFGLDASGPGFGIVKSVGASGQVLFEYDDLSLDFFGFEIGITTMRAGFGGHTELSDTTALLFEVSYESIEASFLGASAETNGYGFRVGVRTMVNESLELDAGIRHLDFDGLSDDVIGVGAVYLINERFGVTFAIEDGEDQTMRFGGRLSF